MSILDYGREPKKGDLKKQEDGITIQQEGRRRKD